MALHALNNYERVKLRKLLNPEKFKVQAAASYQRHKEKRKAESAAYYAANRAYCIQRQIAYEKERMKTDAAFNLLKRLRARLGVALRRALIEKKRSSFKLLGCSIAFFLNWIEKQFTFGMSWERYLQGDIHLDHVKPCALFDLAQPGQITLCFHYSNYQPLWSTHNLQKGVSYVAA